MSHEPYVEEHPLLCGDVIEVKVCSMCGEAWPCSGERLRREALGLATLKQL